MIDDGKIAGFIEDYSTVFSPVEQFVCPITLRGCSKEELVDGHILNAGFLKASRRTVVQYGALDHFYGTRVEPALVEYLNLKNKTRRQLLVAGAQLTAHFEDGTTARAFSAESSSGKKAGDKFPKFIITVEGDKMPVCICVDHADPRIDGNVQIRMSRSFLAAHWVAAMLKAAMLAMFDLIGYRAIISPSSDTIRTTLARYFYDKASADDAATYFHDLQHSVKMLGTGATPQEFLSNYKPLAFDTLEDRIVLLHFSSLKAAFAATCLFKINDVTITVTLPTEFSDGDGVRSWSLYSRLMENSSDLQQSVHRAQFDGEQWNVEKTPLNVHYLGDNDVALD